MYTYFINRGICFMRSETDKEYVMFVYTPVLHENGYYFVCSGFQSLYEAGDGGLTGVFDRTFECLKSSKG